jgi:hypothetical protein
MAPEVPFLQHLDGSEEPNMIWRAVHRFEEWSTLSELALRLVTCGTSEIDAEHLLSMQRNIAGLHGTCFGLPSMEARLRDCASRPTPVQVSLGAMGGGDELDDLDASQLSSRRMILNTVLVIN